MIESGYIMALLIFIVIFMMPIISCELRQSRSVLFVYWFVISLHQAVAFTNAFLFTTIGANADASTFQRAGVELAQFGSFSFSIGSKFYENMLGVVYWLIGPSHLLGEQLSILAFALSCVVLIKMLRLLELSHYAVSILLAFGALPTMVLLGSVTLRESSQVLFFMLAVYYGIKMHMQGGINIYLIALIMSSISMGFFHKGLIVYAAFLIVLFMVWGLWPVSRFWNIKKLRLMAVLTVPALLAGIVMLTKMQLHGLSALTALTNMNLLEAASNYREHAVVARATYGVALDLSSSFTGIYTSFVLYIHYLFAPFPWQVRNILDVYASMESILRMLLIYFGVMHWRNANGTRRRLLGLMLILFFSMSFMWAMGTSNYGTAMRHHMLTWWLLVITGLPNLMARLNCIRLGSMVRMHAHSSDPTNKNS